MRPLYLSDATLKSLLELHPIKYTLQDLSLIFINYTIGAAQKSHSSPSMSKSCEIKSISRPLNCWAVLQTTTKRCLSTTQ